MNFVFVKITFIHQDMSLQLDPWGTGTKSTKWELANMEKRNKSFLSWPTFERNFNPQVGKSFNGPILIY